MPQILNLLGASPKTCVGIRFKCDMDKRKQWEIYGRQIAIEIRKENTSYRGSSFSIVDYHTRALHGTKMVFNCFKLFLFLTFRTSKEPFAH